MDKITLKIIPILKKYGVSRASLFGSVVRGDTHKNSDVDILVEFELEDVLKKKVDLVEYDYIKPRLKSHILGEQVKIL